MDASIGKLLDCLDRKGLKENTIVLFFSDNGGGGGSSNYPLRGGKARTWEGGIRVLALARWPSGGIPAGTVNDAFLTSLELFPSLAAATGSKLPEDVKIDGYNWWATLRGETESPRNEMFWKRKGRKSARIGNWKWVDMEEEGGGLFDLSNDIGEKNDLSTQHPEVLKRIKQRFDEWYQETMFFAEPRGPFKDF
jgi:arylsulfatase A-like enzyme